MKSKLVAGFLVVGSVMALSSSACINGSRAVKPKQQLPADLFKLVITLEPEPVIVDSAVATKRPSLSEPKAEKSVSFDKLNRKMIADYEKNPAAHASFNQRIDYSAALIYSGRSKDAIAVLLQLEKDAPDNYATASNIGTAYELTGNLSEALLWIRRGIELNADSHQGTEWLHVAIVETKLKLAEDPEWLVKNSVLAGHENRSRAEKYAALVYQINERLNFIRENDPVMCDLFYQAALATDAPAQKTYFATQAPRFGDIRATQLMSLKRG